MRFFAALAVAVLAIAACGDGGESDDTTTSSMAVATTTTTALPTTTTQSLTEEEANLLLAEAFVDAFYSFDPDELLPILSSAELAIPLIAFFQGWTEGANYEMVKRNPCGETGFGIACTVTGKSDLTQALNLDFDVDDTFQLRFVGGELIDVSVNEPDHRRRFPLPAISPTPELADQAFTWLFDRSPELLDGVCANMFDGGTTPGECAQAVVQGFKDFAASDDFPDPA